MIEQHVRTFLLGQPAIAALVGARIYCGFLVQAPSLPAITLTMVGSYPQHSLDATPAQLTKTEMQVDCWGETYASVKTLADKIRLALSNYRGDLATGVPISASVMVYQSDGDEEEDLENYRVVMRFELWHNDSSS